MNIKSLIDKGNAVLEFNADELDTISNALYTHYRINKEERDLALLEAITNCSSILRYGSFRPDTQ